MKKSIVLGISGGSSLELTFNFIRHFPKDYMLYVVPSKNSEFLCKVERNTSLIREIENIRSENIEIHKKMCSKLASGSFYFESCIVLPTSSNTLSAVASGSQSNLLKRVCAVCLKEGRKLILCLREMPLSTILLENMHKLSLSGVCIAPPVAGYYAGLNTLEALHDFLIGRYFDMLGIENELFRRWG